MQKKPLSIYVHIPFCQRKCNYCSFISFDCCKNEQIEQYINSLCEEIRSRGELFGERTVKTIYFGGGTPSMLSCAQITKIFEQLRSSFKIAKTAEITVECNPNSVTPEKLECYRLLGVNRISLGVQSTHRTTLKTLGRNHTRKQVHAAMEHIEKAGFTNVSVDFILGVPFPAHECTSAEIRDLALDIVNLLFNTSFASLRYQCIKHLSVYTLTVEANTRIESAIMFGTLAEPDEQDWLQEMSDLKFVIDASPFRMYEVSNYAVSGYECKHNQVYWNPQKDYLGLGLAAHSLVDNKRFANTEVFNEYLKNPVQDISALSPRAAAEVINETIMLALRTTRGISLVELRLLGYDVEVQKAKEIELLRKLGLIRLTETHLRATRKGFNLLNQIIEKLTP